MRTILFVTSIIFPCILCAQEKSPVNSIKKVIMATGVPERIEAMRDYERMWSKPEEEKEVMAQFEESVPVFLQNVEEYYLKTYSQDEIKELLTFYDSPLGKKISSNAANLNAAYEAAEVKWEELFSEVFFKYKTGAKK